MTFEERLELRQRRDQAIRARLEREPRAERSCKRCGCDMGAKTPGCKACWSRHRNRNRLRSPEYRALERDRARQRRASPEYQAKVRAERAARITAERT